MQSHCIHASCLIAYMPRVSHTCLVSHIHASSLPYMPRQVCHTCLVKSAIHASSLPYMPRPNIPGARVRIGGLCQHNTKIESQDTAGAEGKSGRYVIDPQSICATQVASRAAYVRCAASRAAYVRCGGALSALPSASTNAPAQGEACERWLQESCARMGSRNSQSPSVAVAVGAASHLVHGAGDEAAHAQRHCLFVYLLMPKDTVLCLFVYLSMSACINVLRCRDGSFMLWVVVVAVMNKIFDRCCIIKMIPFLILVFVCVCVCVCVCSGRDSSLGCPQVPHLECNMS